MRVAVVGAGIVGASVAFRLARGGTRVWLLDETCPASGTTSSSFAWVNANSKTPREYFELNRAGMEEHSRLAGELSGGAPWLHTGGNLIRAGGANRDDLGHRVERLRSWGYSAEWWQAFRVNELLEPHLRFPAPDAPVAFFPEEAWVDAPRLTRTLVRLAARSGAETRFGSAVESTETRDGRISGFGSPAAKSYGWKRSSTPRDRRRTGWPQWPGGNCRSHRAAACSSGSPLLAGI